MPTNAFDWAHEWIGPDGCDRDYQGSDREPTYMNDIVETELGRMTLREYSARIMAQNSCAKSRTKSRAKKNK